MASAIILTSPAILQSGVYLIICKISKKIYCGSSVNLHSRKIGHLSCLKRGVHCNKELQEDFKKYGAKNFIFKIIELESNGLKRSQKEKLKVKALLEKGIAYNKTLPALAYYDKLPKRNLPTERKIRIFVSRKLVLNEQ